MKKLLVFMATMALGLVSCQKQELEVEVESKDTFDASIEVLNTPTKTALTPNKTVVWSADDHVAIFRGSTVADEYVASAASVGNSNVKLEPVETDTPPTGDFTAGTEMSCNVAYYPYSKDLSLSGAPLEDGNAYMSGTYYIDNVVLPRVQTYTPNTFSKGAFPMVAVTETEADRNLKFKNILGVLKLQLTGTQIVRSIEIKGHFGEYLSGIGRIVAFTDNWDPMVIIEQGSSVVLHCDEGVQLDELKATEFMIALPPVFFSDGFTAVVTDVDGNVYNLSTNVANEVKRSAILVMPPVSLDGIEPDVDDIYGAYEWEYLDVLTGIYDNIVRMNNWNYPFSDSAQAEFVRAFWTLQELPADAVKIAWQDSYTPAFNNTDLSAAGSLEPTLAVYLHCVHVVSSVNDFLRQTTEMMLDKRGCSEDVKAKIQQYRAEARFLRSYFYWVAMDVFGLFPFTTEDTPVESEYYPTQLSRKELFDYVVAELEDLSSDDSKMPAAHFNYPRADKGSVLGLLARVYLNASVYSGNPRWEDAKRTCERLFELDYNLAPTHAELFRGDNGENLAARRETLFAVAYDSELVQSYGGTTFLTSASLSGEDSVGDMIGVLGAWGGIRVPYEYVSTWFKDVMNPNYATGEYTYTDQRASYFHIKGRSQSMEYGLNNFMNGWSYVKFNNIPHNQSSVDWLSNFSDIDFPLIRLGEVYLIYAEACYRLGLSQEAMGKLQELASRAGAELPNEVTEEYILAERSRELMWEGHRRTDLIRFGKWISGYNWTYKGGVFEGQDLPSHYDLYPIPDREIMMNPTLQQNPGY